MFVKQLSVFIENREGRLEQVTEVLKEENINSIDKNAKKSTFLLYQILSFPILLLLVHMESTYKKCLREE